MLTAAAVAAATANYYSAGQLSLFSTCCTAL